MCVHMCSLPRSCSWEIRPCVLEITFFSPQLLYFHAKARPNYALALSRALTITRPAADALCEVQRMASLTEERFKQLVQYIHVP